MRPRWWTSSTGNPSGSRRLVEDLLELSRLDAPRSWFDMVPVDLARALPARGCETIVPESARPRAGRRCTCCPLGCWPRPTSGAIEQVLLNLLDNAVKYTPGGGSIRVTARRWRPRASWWCATPAWVSSASTFSRIFERFYRVDKGRSRDMGGTGLGLSIVKHLMNAMEGDVRVESQLGTGSTFTISLPLA